MTPHDALAQVVRAIKADIHLRNDQAPAKESLTIDDMVEALAKWIVGGPDVRDQCRWFGKFLGMEATVEELISCAEQMKKEETA
jgi:hypothetical protein